VARIRHGREQHISQQLARDKAELALSIHSVERAIASEKAHQSAASSQCEGEVRRLTAAINLQRNVDSLIADNKLDDTEDRAASPLTLVDGVSVDDGVDDVGAVAAVGPGGGGGAAGPSTALLKQQKRVLVKAVRQMNAQVDAVRQQRIAYQRRLADLQARVHSAL
jgi:hypothetical protein